MDIMSQKSFVILYVQISEFCSSCEERHWPGCPQMGEVIY